MAKMLIYTGQTAAIEIVALKTTEQALKQLFFFFSELIYSIANFLSVFWNKNIQSSSKIFLSEFFEARTSNSLQFLLFNKFSYIN